MDLFLDQWLVTACGSTWGKWLLLVIVVDKCVEALLGELARRQIIPTGSVLGLLAIGIFRLSWWLVHRFKKREGI